MRRNLVYGLCFLLVAVVAGGAHWTRFRLSRSPTSLSRPVVQWDLSTSHDISVVGWPAANTDHIWYIMGPGVVELRLPIGRKVEYPFNMIQVRRSGKTMDAVIIFSPAENLELAHQRAATVLDEWGWHGHDSLDQWRLRRRKDPDGLHDFKGANWSGFDVKDAGVIYGVDIRSTFAEDVPWTVVWSMGWLPPAATTHPSTHRSPSR